MVKWISLGEINKYLFFPFVGGMITLSFSEFLGRIDTNFKKHPFIRGINSGFGMSLSIIPFLIIKFRSKAINKDYSKNIVVYENVKKEEKKKLLKGKYLLLLTCAILDFIQKELSFSIIHDSENNVWIFDLLFFVIFSKFILNEKFYRHQYLSLLLMMIILIISIAVYDYNKIKEKIADFFLVLYIEFVYSVNHVLNKYVMETKFCTPYEVSFYQGLFCLIMNIILLCIFSNVEISKNSGVLKVFNHQTYDGKIFIDNFKYYIDGFDTTEFFAFFLNSIYRVTYNLFSLLTIKHFTPAHVIIILFLVDIDYFVETTVKGNYVSTPLIFIILFFLILVFTELIELNFLGISKNTKKNIKERAIKEENNSNTRADSFNNKIIEIEDGLLIELPVNEKE